jgi:chitinase
LEDLGLDGLDVDYEYPSNDEQAWGYVSLLAEMRAALDEHSLQKEADYRFLLTVSFSRQDLSPLLHNGILDRSPMWAK